jgi:hypothetical protein
LITSIELVIIGYNDYRLKIYNDFYPFKNANI